jgi:hypothetical protein
VIEGDAVVHELELPVPRLRLVHDGLSPDLGLLHDDGWSRFLDRLAAVVTGREPAEYPAEQPDQRLAELHRQRD